LQQTGLSVAPLLWRPQLKAWYLGRTHEMIPDKHIWIFTGSGGQFAGGVFSTLALANDWIRRGQLSGVLTAYPVDEGCFDWAIRVGVVTGSARERGSDPHFVGAFTSASQDHFHFENGEPA